MANPLDKFFHDSQAGADPAILIDDLRAIAGSDSNALWWSDPMARAMRHSAEQVLKSPDGRPPLELFNQDLAEIALEHPHLLLSRDARATDLRNLATIAMGLKGPVQQRQSISSTGHNDPDAKTLPNGECAHCGTPAGLSCGGCRDAPYSVERTFYCNPNCQKAYWSRHKPLCTRLQKRAILYRAAKMLRELVYLLRSKTYRHDITKVEEKRGILYLHTNDESAQADLFPYRPLAAQLTKTQDIKEASMVVQYCEEHLGDFHRLMRSFLEGTYSDIQEVRVRVKNAHRPTAFVESEGRVRNNMFHRHAVLRVTLDSGEVYCVDATGAQFGWKEAVLPWDDFVSTRVWFVRDTQPFGSQLANQIMLARSGSSCHADLLDASVACTLTNLVFDLLKVDAMDVKKLLKLPSARFEEKGSELLEFASIGLDGYIYHLKRDAKWAMVDEGTYLALFSGYTKIPAMAG